MVVVDANLFVALVSGDQRGDRVLQQLVQWIDHDVELHAPMLALYEFTNALTRPCCCWGLSTGQSGSRMDRFFPAAGYLSRHHRCKENHRNSFRVRSPDCLRRCLHRTGRTHES